jgi:hypothetical protein
MSKSGHFGGAFHRHLGPLVKAQRGPEGIDILKFIFDRPLARDHSQLVRGFVRCASPKAANPHLAVRGQLVCVQ